MQQHGADLDSGGYPQFHTLKDWSNIQKEHGGLFSKPSLRPCSNGLCDVCGSEGCPNHTDGLPQHFLRIRGGRQLKGTVRVHGAKNSVLPILAASVLCQTPVLLSRVPRLSDTGVSLRILESLGCRTALSDSEAVIDPSQPTGCRIADRLVREMRSSVIFLGSVAARMGEAFLCLPGGCELGARPIDLHLMGLRALGMKIEEQGEKLHATHHGLRGTVINLPFPSVGATENILLAAVTARGETVLRGAAREPEIVDLCGFLRQCGGRIVGDGSEVIYIEGVEQLHGCAYTVMADRIEAATLLCCGGICGGKVTISDFDPATISSLLSVLRKMNCQLSIGRSRVTLQREGPLLSPGEIETAPYPGFPTDVQPMLMALCSLAEGETVIREKIFESRFKHLSALRQMGANIRTDGETAVLQGVPNLYGTDLTAQDLRGGAALLTAALAAEGESRLFGLFHLNRGYEHPARSLTALGADVEHVMSGFGLPHSRT